MPPMGDPNMPPPMVEGEGADPNMPPPTGDPKSNCAFENPESEGAKWWFSLSPDSPTVTGPSAELECAGVGGKWSSGMPPMMEPPTGAAGMPPTMGAPGGMAPPTGVPAVTGKRPGGKMGNYGCFQKNRRKHVTCLRRLLDTTPHAATVRKGRKGMGLYGCGDKNRRKHVNCLRRLLDQHGPHLVGQGIK